MKTLEDEWYIVIKTYKLAVFEILGDFFVLPYIACLRYPYITVYRLYEYVLVNNCIVNKILLELVDWAFE